MKTIKKILAAAMAGTVCLAGTAAVNVQAQELYFWGYSATGEDFAKMTEVSDNGYLSTLFTLSRKTSQCYMNGETVKSGAVWENSKGTVYVVAPRETELKIVFNEGIAKDEAVALVTEVYSGICKDDGEETVGKFNITGSETDGLVSVNVDYAGDIELRYEKCTDSLAKEFMTKLNDKGKISAFYDWNNVFDYYTAIGNFTECYTTDDESYSLDRMQALLDKDFAGKGLTIAKTEANKWKISSEKDLTNITYFEAFVALKAEFNSLEYKWGSPVSSTANLVGENALDSFEQETPAPAATVKNGDVNKDNKVTSEDATMILIEYAAALNDGKKIKAEDMPGGDFNNSGYVDSLDATAILIDYAERLMES